MTSRLLSEAEAREYCGGVNPHKVCAPRRFGRAIRWDRCEIDAALDAPWKQTKPSESEGFDDEEIKERYKRATQGAA